jgi:hypothetical protein
MTEGGTWLQLSSTSGTTPGVLGVSVNTAVLSPGNYTGRIRISSSAAGVTNSPQDVTVSVVVRGVKLVVSPTKLTYQVAYGQFSTKAVSISSAGGSSPIQWQAEVIKGETWLTATPSAGVAPTTLNVTVSGSAAGIGARSGTIEVRALDPQVADSPQYITVDITVPDPGFVVTPNQLVIWQQIGGQPTQKQVSVWRGGPAAAWVATAVPLPSAAAVVAAFERGEAEVSAAGVDISGQAVPAPSWLSFSPDNGTTTSAPTIMTVTANAAAPGVYKAMIIVVATDPATPNRVQTVEVTAYVATRISTIYVPLALR